MIDGLQNRRLTSAIQGELIGKALKADGISQVDFAQMVGVSEKHLSQVIRGVAPARGAALDYWAWVLGRRWSVGLDPRRD